MNPTARDSATRYDVIILGSGLPGAMLGAILARGGARVLILDSRVHPRYAPGEVSTPRALLALRLLAERYQVPEIKTLTTFQNCTRIIGASFGIKRHFGFLLHHEGSRQQAGEVSQVTNGPLSDGPHLYRQDTDAYLFLAAIRYGAAARQGFRIAGLDITGAGVSVGGADGSIYHGRYLVDATGPESVLAEQLALRETPTRLRHTSRGLATLMVGVRDTDEVLGDRLSRDRPPVPWHQGTVHHLFERGWFGVVPFGNHEDSRNLATSVTLTLDPACHPIPPGSSPQEEFFAHAARFPDVARQFEGSALLREWEVTDRLQYSSVRTVGDRWCLLGAAAGYVDPLFARELSDTAETINALAWRLLRAVADDDFSAGRFAFVDQLQQSLLDFDDALVSSAYAAFADYDLWNAVFRIWAWGSGAGSFRMQQALSRFLADGSQAHLNELEGAPYPGCAWPDSEGYCKLFTHMAARCDACRSGQVKPAEASAELFSMIAESGLFPRHLGFAEPQVRFIHPTPGSVVRSLWLARDGLSPQVRHLLMDNARTAARSRLRGRRIF